MDWNNKLIVPAKMKSQGRSIDGKGQSYNADKDKFNPDKVESKFSLNLIKMNLR